MEQESSQFPLRPAHTDDLVQRLHDADANYSNALQTNRMQSLASAGLRHLSTSMIKSFKAAPQPDENPHLVALSPKPPPTPTTFYIHDQIVQRCSASRRYPRTCRPLRRCYRF